jgi:hypothetical protein
MIAEIEAQVGRMVFVNRLPDWQLDHEAERERHTLDFAGFLERLGGDQRCT